MHFKYKYTYTLKSVILERKCVIIRVLHDNVLSNNQESGYPCICLQKKNENQDERLLIVQSFTNGQGSFHINCRDKLKTGDFESRKSFLNS